MAAGPAMPTPIYDELLRELALEPEGDGAVPTPSGIDSAPASES